MYTYMYNTHITYIYIHIHIYTYSCTYIHIYIRYIHIHIYNDIYNSFYILRNVVVYFIYEEDILKSNFIHIIYKSYIYI